MTLDLPFQDPEASPLDASLRAIEDAVDEGFLAEIDAAFARAEVDEDQRRQQLL